MDPRKVSLHPLHRVRWQKCKKKKHTILDDKNCQKLSKVVSKVAKTVKKLPKDAEVAKIAKKILKSFKGCQELAKVGNSLFYEPKTQKIRPKSEKGSFRQTGPPTK